MRIQFGKSLPQQIVFCCILLACASCQSQRSSEFQLTREDFGKSAESEQESDLYVIGTLPIEEADRSQMFVDVWKLEDEDYPKEIRVFVRVLDSSGNFITHMAEPYYRGSADPGQYWSSLKETILGRDNDIDQFSVREYGESDTIPYGISLVLDHGGSMGGTIDALQNAAELFVNLKKPHDKIGIIKFGNEPVIQSAMSKNKEQILRQFGKEGLEGFGLYTAVYDAAKEGIMQLKDLPDESPRVLVLFTDGEDNYSKTTDSEVYALAREHKVRIFSVGFGYANDEILQAFSEQTGGKFYKAFNDRELVGIFKDIYNSLRNYYLVSYKPPEYPAVHKVAVGVNIDESVGELVAQAEYDRFFEHGPFINPFDHLQDTTGLGIGSNGKVNDGGDGQTIQISNAVFFDFDSFTLKPAGLLLAKEIADVLHEYPRIEIEIIGHADRGPNSKEEYNQVLSEKRAAAVLRAIVTEGVSKRRLRSRGRGFNEPIAPNDTEENRSRNRRTEFVILRY